MSAGEPVPVEGPVRALVEATTGVMAGGRLVALQLEHESWAALRARESDDAPGQEVLTVAMSTDLAVGIAHGLLDAVRNAQAMRS